MEFHAIFFGRDSAANEIAIMTQIAAEVPGGTFHNSVDGVELEQTFASFAQAMQHAA